MSEFMLITGGEGQTWPARPGSHDPGAILRRMIACLDDLDRIGASLPAIHLDAAIQHLRRQFDLDGDTSGSD